MSTRRRFLGTMTLPAAAAAMGIPFRPSALAASATDVARELARHTGTARELAGDEERLMAQVRELAAVVRRVAE